MTRVSAPPCDGGVCLAMAIVREDSAQLSDAAMDSVHALLSDSTVVWPIPLVEPALQCADAPWWNAKIAYADGHVAYFDKPEEICTGLPAGYEKVSMLAWSLVQRLGWN